MGNDIGIISENIKIISEIRTQQNPMSVYEIEHTNKLVQQRNEHLKSFLDFAIQYYISTREHFAGGKTFFAPDGLCHVLKLYENAVGVRRGVSYVYPQLQALHLLIYAREPVSSGYWFMDGMTYSTLMADVFFERRLDFLNECKKYVK